MRDKIDQEKLDNLSEEKKIELTSFESFMSRRNVLYHNAHFWYVTKNEYPYT
jgi:hypothetical protein